MNPCVREAFPGDLKYVHSSWHTSFWKTSARKYLTRGVYDRGQDQRIDRLISRSNVLVAYFPEVEDEILGWACIEGDVLHYAYVKAIYRRRGIASGLTGNRVKIYSHASDRVGESFAESIGAQFNPYALEHL